MKIILNKSFIDLKIIKGPGSLIEKHFSINNNNNNNNFTIHLLFIYTRSFFFIWGRIWGPVSNSTKFDHRMWPKLVDFGRILQRSSSKIVKWHVLSRKQYFETNIGSFKAKFGLNKVNLGL